jgi:hypothetical protein
MLFDELLVLRRNEITLQTEAEAKQPYSRHSEDNSKVAAPSSETLPA